MKGIIVFAIIVSILIAGCAGGGSQASPSAPSAGASIQQPPPGAPNTVQQGSGFSLNDNSTLQDTNGSNPSSAAPSPPPATNPPNSTAPVTSGSGGQIVDVGGSIPVNAVPSGSGN